MNNKQNQKAGDNSQQIQAEVINLQVGIDEKRAREIYSETADSMRKEFTVEAFAIANARVQRLEDILMPKMAAINGALNHFSDPSFQLLLADAHKAAAATEREADYDLLSELLIERVKKGEERNIRAGINIAVKIIDQISDDALLGLTVAHLIVQIVPNTGNIMEGLNVFEDIFGKIVQRPLPSGEVWIDHLDILGAVRLNPLSSMKKIADRYQKNMDGYISVGIEKGSEHYLKAEKILESVSLPKYFMVPHELMDSHVRLPVVNKHAIDPLGRLVKLPENNRLGIFTASTPLSKERCDALRMIYDLYDTDKNKRQDNLTEFMKMWDSKTTLASIRTWWENIPVTFNITSAGNVLARANAQRFDRAIPNLE